MSQHDKEDITTSRADPQDPLALLHHTKIDTKGRNRALLLRAEIKCSRGVFEE